MNETGITESGVHDDYYDVIGTYFDGTLGSDTVVRFAQYDNEGHILKVTNISLEDKTTN